MRENLFHGKRKDNGKWVEGYYVPVSEYHYILTGKLELVSYLGFEHFLIIPETVGQYAGSPDKNGKKIFEGDICKVTVFICEGEDKHFLCEVCFDYSSFIFRERSGLDILFSNICDFDTDVEVIGNIYDNPELIGGRTNE